MWGHTAAWLRSSYHSPTALMDLLMPHTAPVNDRFRLGADGRVGASHCLRLPIPDIGRCAGRVIAIGESGPCLLKPNLPTNSAALNKAQAAHS